MKKLLILFTLLEVILLIGCTLFFHLSGYSTISYILFLLVGLGASGIGIALLIHLFRKK